MRKYGGINAGMIKDYDTRRALEAIDMALRGLTVGVSRVGSGWRPDATGSPIEDPPTIHPRDRRVRPLEGGPWMPADLQAAVDATPEGELLWLGPGTYLAPSGGLLIRRAIEIRGSGPETVIMPYALAVNQPAIRFLVEEAATPTGPSGANDVYLHDFRIYGGAAEPTEAPDEYAGSYGIAIETFIGGNGQRTREIFIERVQVDHMGDHGLYVTGDGGASAVFPLRISNCKFNQNWGHGMKITGSTMTLTTSVMCAYNYGMGAEFSSCSPVCIDDYYENNCHNQDYTTGYYAQAKFYAGIVNLVGVTFEDFNNDSSNETNIYLRQRQVAGEAGTMTALCLQSVSGRVSGLRFYNSASNYDIDERAIFVDNSSTGNAALEIGPCQFDGVYVGLSNNASVGTTRGLSVAYQNQHTYDALLLGHPGLALPTSTSALMDSTDFVPGHGVHGNLLFDETLGAARLWSLNSWREVVAGQISYDDDAVMLDDEPVTY